MTRSGVALLCALAAMSVPAAGAAPRAAAARAASDRTWVAAWGYVVSPPPPGQQPAPFTPFAGPVIPLGPALAPANSPTPPKLIENPGHVPIDTGTVDLVDATMRQVVRVSADGSAVRLRLSNEGGVDALAIGAMHVGFAEPDGSVLPGSDHVVTFAGLPGTNIPAGAPLLSDPVTLPVKALDRLAISL